MKNELAEIPARAAPFIASQEGQFYGQPFELPSQTELLILWAIWSAGSNGVYGLDIQRAIEECSWGNESISTGSLYSLLKRLRSKGYVDSWEGDAPGGGARRQYYYLTDSGVTVAECVSKFFFNLQKWTP